MFLLSILSLVSMLSISFVNSNINKSSNQTTNKVNAPLVMNRYNSIESENNNGVYTYGLTDLINSYNFDNYVKKKQAIFDTLFEPQYSIPSLSTLTSTYYDLYTNDASGVTWPATFGSIAMGSFDIENGSVLANSITTYNTIALVPLTRTRIGGETPPKTNNYYVEFDLHFYDSDYSNPSSPVVNTDRNIAKLRVERWYVGDTPFYNVSWVEIYNVTTIPRFTPGNNVYLTEPSGGGLANGALLDHNNYWNSLFYTDYDTFYNNGYNAGYQEGLDTSYSEGYQEGYIAGKDEVNYNGTAQTIFSGIVSVGLLPVNVFLRILNFEVLGINISGFVSALLTVSIVIIIIRTITGGKKDD